MADHRPRTEIGIEIISQCPHTFFYLPVVFLSPLLTRAAVFKLVVQFGDLNSLLVYSLADVTS